MAGIEIDTKTTDHQQLYKQGVRAYVLQDYDSAVRAFSRCSELIALKYNDDQHDSLGDVYLYYGKSLLGLSRQELEPLNENIIKNDEDEDDDDDDDEDDDDEDDEQEGKDEQTKDKGNQDVKQDNSDGNKTTEQNGIAVVNGEDKKPEINSNNQSLEEKDDELTDLQVAWEVLELAKQIFLKRGDNGRNDLAETLIVLGEISLESGNFQTGIVDIRNGLEIQKKLYTNDDRTIAETYYKLGTALSTNQQVDESIVEFQESLKTLQLHLEKLKKSTTNNDEDIKDEIKEIEDLIPEIEEKITDMKSYKLELLKKDENNVDKPQSSSSSSASASASASSSTSKQANDISHLIKRKRPSEDGVSSGGANQVPSKKPSL